MAIQDLKNKQQENWTPPREENSPRRPSKKERHMNACKIGMIGLDP
jgi:hypothetical protein